MEEYKEQVDVLIDDRLAKLIDKTVAALNSNENKITLMEFRKYEPIFSREEAKKGDNDVDYRCYLANLYKEYVQRIDIRKPVKVVDGEEVILTLPAILNKTNPLDADSDAANIFQNLGTSDIPSKKSYATRQLVQELFNANSTDKYLEELETRRQEVKEQMDNFIKLYSVPESEDDNNPQDSQDEDKGTDILDEVNWE